VARSGARRQPAPARVREILTPADPALKAAHRLLGRSFSVHEITPAGDWVQSLRERDQGLWTDFAWHLVVAEVGGRVVGAASGSYLGNVNVGAVGYLVVVPRARALGLGPRMRKRLVSLFERDARRARGLPLAAVIGEVKEDSPWLKTLVRRRGAIALDFPYYQPAIGAQGERVPLVLYYEPLSRPRRFLSAAELRRLLYTLFRRGYRIARPLSRPAFRRMMRALVGRRRIGQRQLVDSPVRP